MRGSRSWLEPGMDYLACQRHPVLRLSWPCQLIIPQGRRGSACARQAQLAQSLGLGRGATASFPGLPADSWPGRRGDVLTVWSTLFAGLDP